MNSLSFRLSFLLGLTALTVVSGSLSARAETPSQNPDRKPAESSVTPVQVAAPAATSAATTESQALNSASSSQRSQSSTALMQPVESTSTPAIAVDPQAINANPTPKGFGSVSAPLPTIESNATSRVTNPVAPSTPAPQMANNTASQVDGQQTNSTAINQSPADSQKPQSLPVGNNQPTSAKTPTGVTAAAPMPGTLATSAAALAASPQTPSKAPSNQPNNAIAQTNTNSTIEPGRATRGGSSYIGIGGNIGLGGGSALGDGAFAVTSKIGFTPTISFRPAAIIGDETAFLLPVTYDFVIQSADPFAPIPFAPYLGGGAAITTEGDVGFLLTGGVDVPLSREFVANAAINVDFGDDTNVGLFLGVGYTFPSLFQR